MQPDCFWIWVSLGKTVISLSAIEKLIYDFFEVRKVLVIAPLRPATDTWPVEIRKWEHLKDLKYSVVVGSVNERLRALYEDSDIYIINRENVVWLVEYYKQRWPFDMVVIDELSSFKSAKSQRFKALRKVRKYINRIVGLTGTPTPNGLLDLWPQMYLLDEGLSLGKTLTSYRDKYFLPDKRNGHIVYSWRLKENAETEIYEKIADCCISMKTEDYVNLPERLSITHKVTLPKSVTEQYKQLKRDLILPFPNGDIDAASAGILTNKLLQFCGGDVYDENGKSKEFHTEKLKMLEQLIEEANGQPVLVFYAYKHERDKILKMFPEAVDVKNDNTIENWNKGKIQILLAHPASAGHGLNLQFGGHIAIWYNLTWSLEFYQQANKRLHRMGQKESVLMHHIVVSGGLDERILETVLTQKEKSQNALLDAVKAEVGL
jgi:SNF2 family DNA or RNA helicase